MNRLQLEEKLAQQRARRASTKRPTPIPRKGRSLMSVLVALAILIVSSAVFEYILRASASEAVPLLATETAAPVNAPPIRLSLTSATSSASAVAMQVCTNIPEGRLLGILPTFFDEQTTESAKSMTDLQTSFGESMLAPIHRATILRECAAEGKTIFEMDPASRASREYEELSRVIVKRS